jgi:hypothetical protein
MKVLVAVAAVTACAADPTDCPQPTPMLVPVTVAAPPPPPPAPPPDLCNVRATVAHFADKGVHFWLDDDRATRARAAWIEATTLSLQQTETATDDAREFAGTVAHALKEHDYRALAKLAAPRVCLRAAKGAPCRWMDNAELARCGHGRSEEWAVDTGASTEPRLDCAGAFAQIFYNRDYANATPKVNCFPEPGRGNNYASIMDDELPTVLYVELYDEDDRGMWGALWLHLGYDPSSNKLRLLGLTSEYWGI